MVFSSVPVYLDPPNWQQQQTNHQQGGGCDQNNPQLPQQPSSEPRCTSRDGSGSLGSIKPGSMSDRARLANIPQPETALKCPRCESTNTKFCYFNNYSLSQPRHFCKTCRRYWTRGGTLRSVPVGGGCRRNKRSKGGNSSRSKSPGAAGNSSSSTVNSSNSCSTSDNIIDRLTHPPPPPHQLHFLPSLHHLTDYGSGDMIGLNNFGGINQPGDVEFQHHQYGSDRLSARPNILGMNNMSSSEHWRSSLLQQQFPNFLSNLEPPPSTTHGMYQFDGDHQNVGQLPISKPLDHSAGNRVTTTQMVNVKMEHSHQALNLSRNFLGSLGNDHQYWGTSTAGTGGSVWTDLSGFTSSSSTTHLL
ncbi:unnamed protein product [Malus baccata var. baccata]